MRVLLACMLLGCYGILGIEKASIDSDASVPTNDTGSVDAPSVETAADTSPADALERCARPWNVGTPCSAPAGCTAPLRCLRGRCIDTNWAYWPMPTARSYSVYTDFVIDNVTCLMWERTTDSVGRGYSDAPRYCRDLRAGGFDDWRLPTRIELISLQDPSRGPPGIDNTVFSDVPSCGAFCPEGDWFWTSNIYDANGAFTVRFDGNSGFGPSQKTQGFRIRCVR